MITRDAHISNGKKNNLCCPYKYNQFASFNPSLSINEKQNDAFCVTCRAQPFSISPDITTRWSRRVWKNTMRRECSKKKGTKERTCSSTSSVSWNAQPRFEVYAWASSTPSIRYSRRRSRMGSIPPTFTSAAPVWESREPPIFSYRILVCVHARRAINGKILESCSGNPDTGLGFHGSVLRLPWTSPDLSSLLTLRPLNLLPRFSTLSFRSLSRPILAPVFSLTT